MIGQIFHTTLYQPIFNVLIGAYGVLPVKDLGLVIILVTVAIRIIFYPLSKSAARSQRNLAKIQPKIKELQEKHKGNKEEQSKAMMAFYKENKVNPIAGCVPMLIQLPVLIALFAVFNNGLDPEAFKDLYSFVPAPGDINTRSFGFLELTQKSPLWLAFAAGAAQFVQSAMMLKTTQNIGTKEKKEGMDMNAMIAFQTKYFFPIMTVLFAINFKTALGLYLLATTAVSVVQQYFINKSVIKGENSA